MSCVSGGMKSRQAHLTGLSPGTYLHVRRLLGAVSSSSSCTCTIRNKGWRKRGRGWSVSPRLRVRVEYRIDQIWQHFPIASTSHHFCRHPTTIALYCSGSLNEGTPCPTSVNQWDVIPWLATCAQSSGHEESQLEGALAADAGSPGCPP